MALMIYIFVQMAPLEPTVELDSTQNAIVNVE